MIFSANRLRNTTVLETQMNQEDQKYATFHYTRQGTQNIANRFKKFNVKVAFKTNSTLCNMLNSNIENCNKFNRSGIYKINCNDCDNYYIGQTVNFTRRFKEHMSACRNKKPDRSNVAKHLLDCNHTLDNIDNNLNILQVCNKGNIMNAWEELYIYREKCKNRDKLINEHVNFDSSNVYRWANGIKGAGPATPSSVSCTA